MTILKKTLFAGLAAVTLATAGAAVTPTSAEAGYRHYNKHHHYNKHRHYNRHYKYSRHCSYKKVWRTNYYGHGHWVKVKYCY